MFWKWLRFIVCMVLCATVYFIGEFGIPFISNPLPPIGKLVNPYTGFWQNDDQLNDIPETIEFDHIQNGVTIHWDERLVPHIFAENNADLYFTQGYVTAMHRLWQMDFLSRVSGGRLAEVVGPKANEYDLFHRRIGLLESAKRTVDTLKSYPEQYEALQHYAAGVNAWIEQLDAKDYPVEFKLMNYKPERWSPLKSALILKYMAWDLDGGVEDAQITKSYQLFSDSVFQEIYPSQNPFYKPIIPSAEKPSTTGPSFNRRRSGFSGNRQPISQREQPSDYFLPSFLTKIDRDYQKGSNNWVVNGEKTRSGFPILANDPHLSLSLPAIWYENQLVSPDVNVYGVSLPGVPMVVIGFNQQIAWGLTYTASDPIDFTAIELNKEGNQYKKNNKWINARIRKDTIRVKAGKNHITETIITEAGPIIYKDSIPSVSYNEMIPGANVAMKWTAQQPTLEFVTMYRLNRANNLADYQDALPYFDSPGQNFVLATQANDIALWHNGKFPVRSLENGRFVNDTLTDNTWNRTIPFNELPHVINPNQNYIVSANQSPVADDYDYYLGVDDYATFERANRINEVIDSLEKITPHDFQNLQLDNHSLLAEELVPTLLQAVDTANLSTEQIDVFNQLKSWNFEFNAIDKSPLIFNTWLSEMRTQIWEDEVSTSESDWQFPRMDVTANFLLNDTTATYFDDRNTERVETRKDIIHSSFQASVDSLVNQYGSLNESWRWGSANPTYISSLANIKGFGSSFFETGGSKRSVNAISGNHGPSWRMIVELGKTPNAFGVYPGGQDGNPGSPNYDNFVDDWASGDYFELHYLLNQSDKKHIQQTTSLLLKEEE